jgi:hypothetical protein
MPTQPTAPEATQAEQLAEAIKLHKEEVARLREEIGDPLEALSAFVREHFSLECLLPDGERAIWEEDDNLPRLSEDMTMASQSATTTQAERREQHLKAHKEEVARLRAEIGDPAQALDRFIVENFSLEALLPYGERAVWEEDDDRDDW